MAQKLNNMRKSNIVFGDVEIKQYEKFKQCI